MIQNIYPLFERYRILKKEYLWSLRDCSLGFMQVEYAEYADGFLTGCGISVRPDCIEIAPGLVKHRGFLYLFPEIQQVPYSPSGQFVSLKFRLKKKQVFQDYIDYTAEPFLDSNLERGEDELELCRFKLQPGFRLRDDYKDFQDIETEFDTVNLLHATWGGLGGPTLAPAITRFFARSVLGERTADPYDLQFCSLCLDRPTAVPRLLIEQYVRVKLELDGEPLDNQALFRHLELILRNLRSGGSLRPPGKHRRSREIFVD